jgi:hypothetical protein
MSWSLVHSALEVLHPNEFQSDVRGYIKATFFMLPLGGLHVKHAVQVTVRRRLVLQGGPLRNHCHQWSNVFLIARDLRNNYKHY